MAAANTIVILVLLTNLIKLGATSFVFNPVNWDNVNLILEIATFLVPFIVYVVANWCLTTLFDGKGTLKDIWMGTAYAMTPYVIIQLILNYYILYRLHKRYPSIYLLMYLYHQTRW